MSKPMKAFDYLLMNKSVSPVLLEKSKKISWNEINTSADPEVIKIRKKIREVRLEIHRMRGFVRFDSINDKILFGYMKPENKIEKLVTDIFARRFQKHIILLGNEKKSWISYYSENFFKRYEESKSLNKMVKDIQSLIKFDSEVDIDKIWQIYYESQYIKERENHRLFYKNMPRKNLKSVGNRLELRLNTKTLDEYL